MIGYTLPTSLEVGGVEFSIRTDFRAVLDVLIAMNDIELSDTEKNYVLLEIIYEDFTQIPNKHLEEACKKAIEFIDCGQTNEKIQPKTIDWEQDAGIIIPAINSVAHQEVRALPYLHWWTFFSYFMEIKDGLLSSVIGVRQKLSKRKKLEEWEREFYKENKHLVDFAKKETEAERQEKDDILKWL